MAPGAGSRASEFTPAVGWTLRALCLQELIQQLQRDVLTEVSGVEWQDIAGLGEQALGSVVGRACIAGCGCLRASGQDGGGKARAYHEEAGTMRCTIRRAEGFAGSLSAADLWIHRWLAYR